MNEVNTLLSPVFAEQRQTGGLDLEAAEMAFRAACTRTTVLYTQAPAKGTPRELRQEGPRANEARGAID